jgi:hypothetical protein
MLSGNSSMEWQEGVDVALSEICLAPEYWGKLSERGTMIAGTRTAPGT